MSKVVAYIALGSNVGDRAETLMRAMKMLDGVNGIEVRRISQMLKTKAVGGPEGQGDYLNGAVEIKTSLAPHELLAALQETESALGRNRAGERRWGPRTCDLDVLLMGDVVIGDEKLTIPHPRMHERLFVLRPLCQIAPDAIHPVLSKTVRQLLEAAEGGG